MDLLKALADVLPDGAIVTAPHEKAAFEADWRHIHQHEALCAVLPQTAEQVSAVLKLCAEAGVRVVPQGGNTGLVAGGVPVPGGRQIVLNLRRMNKILNTDSEGGTITVQAGVTLQAVQQAAADVERLFPLSFGAEGTAQIGGVISTNAGGMQVLSYGSMRAMVLGLEVVLPDGRIWHGLRALRKDNTGFDLKQVFIGGEGTLGIITAAVLRLFPAVSSRATALVGVDSMQAGLDVFQALRARSGAALTLCEYISGPSMALGAAHLPEARLPFQAPCYLLAELSGHGVEDGVMALMEEVLTTALEDGHALDVVIAQSDREREQFLAFREAVPEGELREGGAVKHDIAVPVADMPATVLAVEELVAAQFPDCRLNVFGHIGDGNLHVNVRPPAGQTLANLGARKVAITEAVEALAVARHGSFSAEHAIGQIRVPGMAVHKSAVELDMMRKLKQAFDPAGLLSPGKMLPP